MWRGSSARPALQGLHCAARGARAAPEPRGPAARGPAVRGRAGASSHGWPATPPPRSAAVPGLTALTGSACLAAHQAGVVDELVHLASVCQARAQGRGQGCASRAPGRRWRACPVLRATSGVGGRLGHLWWEAAWARLRTCATVAWTSRCTRPMAALRRCMISSWSNSWSSEYHVPGRGESEWGQEQGQGQGGASASAQGQGHPWPSPGAPPVISRPGSRSISM